MKYIDHNNIDSETLMINNIKYAQLSIGHMLMNLESITDDNIRTRLTMKIMAQMSFVLCLQIRLMNTKIAEIEVVKIGTKRYLTVRQDFRNN